MATAKKGIIDQAMRSKPAKAAKGLIGKAVDAFNDPPLAPDLEQKPMRRTTRGTPVKKSAAARSPAKKMDGKFVSGMEDYEVKYLAQKHSVTQKAVKEAVVKVGHSRNKVEAELKRSKSL